jgi:hypothetical protein
VYGIDIHFDILPLLAQQHSFHLRSQLHIIRCAEMAARANLGGCSHLFV